MNKKLLLAFSFCACFFLQAAEKKTLVKKQEHKDSAEENMIDAREKKDIADAKARYELAKKNLEHFKKEEIMLKEAIAQLQDSSL